MPRNIKMHTYKSVWRKKKLKDMKHEVEIGSEEDKKKNSNIHERAWYRRVFAAVLFYRLYQKKKNFCRSLVNFNFRWFFNFEHATIIFFNFTFNFYMTWLCTFELCTVLNSISLGCVLWINAVRLSTLRSFNGCVINVNEMFDRACDDFLK